MGRLSVGAWINPASVGVFGLRLRLAVTFATNDLYDLLDGGFEEVKMSSFVPGLEFVVPVGDSHLLLPHVDAGIGTESASGKEVLLASIGLRTESSACSIERCGT